MERQVLLCVLQRANKTIGGMASRFLILWLHLNQKKCNKYYLLTTRSLWDKFNKDGKRPKNVIIINDDNDIIYFPIMIFLSFLLLFYSTLYRIKHIHFVGVGYQHIPFLMLSKFFKIANSLTFASNSLKMASYNNAKAYKKWDIILKFSSNVDVLNPTYNLPKYGFKAFVSPCSFPHALYLESIKKFDFEVESRADRIIFCGALESTKNPILAINGFRMFLNEHIKEFPKAKLIIFGKGTLEMEVNMLIENVNAIYGSCVIERVPYEDYFFWLSKSKIFLSLQDFDNYPSQSLMEAMLFCNSVIATNEGDTKRLVFGTGNRVVEKDEKMLSSAIYEVLKGYTLNTTNRQFILENHNLETFGKYFEKMIDDCQIK